jgi:hypothetical protein
MKLPRAMRVARAAKYYSRADELATTFNAGFNRPSYLDVPDALRDGGRLTGNQSAAIDAIAQAATNCPRRRG